MDGVTLSRHLSAEQLSPTHLICLRAKKKTSELSLQELVVRGKYPQVTGGTCCEEQESHRSSVRPEEQKPALSDGSKHSAQGPASDRPLPNGSCSSVW